MKPINVTLQIDAEDEDRFVEAIAQRVGEHLGKDAFDAPAEFVETERSVTAEHDTFVVEVGGCSERREITARIEGNGMEVLVACILMLGLERVFEAQQEIRKLGDSKENKLPELVRYGSPRRKPSLTDYEQFGEYFIVIVGESPQKRDFLERVGERLGVSLRVIRMERKRRNSGH